MANLMKPKNGQTLIRSAKMDIKQINSSIMFGNFTDIELSSIIDAVTFARGCLRKQVKRSLTLGTAVRWTSPKNPRGEQGTVEKIAIKFVTVKTATGMRWKVPANMLEVV
jgi:hypothetical protein